MKTDTYSKWQNKFFIVLKNEGNKIWMRKRNIGRYLEMISSWFFIIKSNMIL